MSISASNITSTCMAYSAAGVATHAPVRSVLRSVSNCTVISKNNAGHNAGPVQARAAADVWMPVSLIRLGRL